MSTRQKNQQAWLQAEPVIREKYDQGDGCSAVNSRSTDAWYWNGTSVVKAVASQVRIEAEKDVFFTTSTGSVAISWDTIPQHVLTEPQRTNYVGYLTGIYDWYSGNIGSSDATTTEVTGLSSNRRVKVTDDSSTGEHTVYKLLDLTTSAQNKACCFGAWLRAGTQSFGIKLSSFGAALGSPSVYYDMDGGNLVIDADGGTGYTGAGIFKYGDTGWYYLWIRMQLGTDTLGYLDVGNAQSNGTGSYTGDGTDYFYNNGAQAEIGDFPTTLIQTGQSGDAVTRNADSLDFEYGETLGDNGKTIGVNWYHPCPKTATNILTTATSAAGEFEMTVATDTSGNLDLSVKDSGASAVTGEHTYASGDEYASRITQLDFESDDQIGFWEDDTQVGTSSAHSIATTDIISDNTLTIEGFGGGIFRIAVDDSSSQSDSYTFLEFVQYIDSGTVSASGTGAVSATGETVVEGTASTSGTAAVSATANAVTVPAIASSAVTGAVSATANAVVIDTATASSAATGAVSATASAVVVDTAVASSSVTGSVSAIGETVVAGIASTSGTAAVSATANAVVIDTATASAAASGVVSATANEPVIDTAIAAVAVSGAVSAIGETVVEGIASTSGTAAVSATSNAVVIDAAIATASGTSTVSATADEPTVFAAASVASAVTVQATAGDVIIGTATISLGTFGNVSATASEPVINTAVAEVPATGSVSADGETVTEGTADMSGTGALSATANAVVIDTATVAAPGTSAVSATANAVIVDTAIATASGAGDVSATANEPTVFAEASVASAITVQATAGDVIIGTAIISLGTFGNVSATASEPVIDTAVASVSATSSLSSTGETVVEGTATSSGTAAVSTTANAVIVDTATATAEGTGAVSATASAVKIVDVYAVIDTLQLNSPVYQKNYEDGDVLDTAETFTRSGSGYYWNGSNIVSAGTNVARLEDSIQFVVIDASDADSGSFAFSTIPKGVLIEPQRTNLLAYSDSNYSINRVTAGISGTESPIMPDSDCIYVYPNTESLSTSLHRIYNMLTASAYSDATNYCASVLIKPGVLTPRILMKVDWIAFTEVSIDPTALTYAKTGNANFNSMGLVKYGSTGWYLFWASGLSRKSDNDPFWIGCAPTGELEFGNWGGDGIDGDYTWHFNHLQFEEGLNPSMPIPTNGAAATRLADDFAINNANGFPAGGLRYGFKYTPHLQKSAMDIIPLQTAGVSEYSIGMGYDVAGDITLSAKNGTQVDLSRAYQSGLEGKPRHVIFNMQPKAIDAYIDLTLDSAGTAPHGISQGDTLVNDEVVIQNCKLHRAAIEPI